MSKTDNVSSILGSRILLTASSAQSVRLVVTLSEAGGSLGYIPSQSIGAIGHWIRDQEFERIRTHCGDETIS